MSVMTFTNMNYNEENLSLGNFDRNAFEHSVRWLSNQYIKKMICAPQSTLSEKEKWFHSLESRDDFKCWVIKYNKMPIGVCGIKNIVHNTRKGEYFGYIGEDNFRGKGLGNRLMNLAKEKATFLGLEYLYLKVRNDNFPALKLYKRHGFIETGNQGNMIFMEMKII